MHNYPETVHSFDLIQELTITWIIIWIKIISIYYLVFVCLFIGLCCVSANMHCFRIVNFRGIERFLFSLCAIFNPSRCISRSIQFKMLNNKYIVSV